MHLVLPSQISFLKTLSHPYIVQLHEVMYSPTKLYIVLELVMGRDLFEIMNEKGPFPEDMARCFFQQLTDGVNYCHAMNIVHRDLKVSHDTGTYQHLRRREDARSCCGVSCQ